MSEYKPLLQVRDIFDKTTMIHVDEIRKITEYASDGKVGSEIHLKDGTSVIASPSDYAKILSFCRF